MKKVNLCALLTIVFVFTGCTPIPTGDQSVAADSSTADVVDPSVEEASTSATSGSEISLSANEFEYNGKAISILDDVPSILEKLGTPDKKEPFQPEYQPVRYSYSFDSDKIIFDTVVIDGEELPFYLNIRDENVRLLKGVHIGCSEEEVRAAYGEPSKTFAEAIDFLRYENDKYELSFGIGGEMNPVDELSVIDFLNVDTKAKFDSYSGEDLDEGFLYNGKEISVLDKPHEKVIPNLGAPFRIDDLSPEGVFLYYFGSETEHIRLETYTYNGEELTESLFINDKTIKTNKGIGVGSTTADVLAAYGDPLPPTDKNDFSMCYKFGQYEIAFHRNSKDGDIVSFAYINLDTFEKYLND